MARKFKIGDKVRFISEKSKNAEFFQQGLENLEIAKYEGMSFRVWESDRSNTWKVNPSELELVESKEEVDKEKKKRFKKGFDILYDYMKYLSDEDKKEVSDRLSEIGL